MPRPTTTQRPYETCPAEGRPAATPYVPGTVPAISLVVWWTATTCYVAVETASGHAIGTVYASDSRPLGAALDPSGTTLFVSEYANHNCLRHIASVDIATGAVTEVAPGELAALRIDGTELAYLPSVEDPRFLDEPKSTWDPCARSTLVIRDLRNGAERFVPLGTTQPIGFDWSPDGRYLAMTSWGADVSHVSLIDLVSGDIGAVYGSSEIGRWTFGGLCCGDDVRGWTPGNKLVVRVYRYVTDLGADQRRAIATGDVSTGDACRNSDLCVELTNNISRDDPDHEGDYARVGDTTLRVWGNVFQLVSPRGVIDLPGPALWPVSVMLLPFD